MTHEEYDWYPAKLLCRRFDVPEPYPGSSQVGCPYIEMLNNKSKNDNEQNNEVQGIFGASMDDLKLFKVEKNEAEEKPSTQSMKQTPSGLSSAVDLLKAAEDQFTSTSSEMS